MAITLLFCFAFSACGNQTSRLEQGVNVSDSVGGNNNENVGGNDDTELPSNINYYTVTFKVDGNNYGEPKLLKHGDKIEMPKTPSKQDATNDYSFDGWFLGDTKWDFDSDTVEFDVELNAKWKIGATYTEDFLPSGIN